jgi:hypothetical protein
MLLAACVSVVCYWLFVRPTINAERFIEAIESKDYILADSMCASTHRENLGDRIAERGDAQVKVEILPRHWRDYWRFKRRLLVRVIPNVSNYQGSRVGLQFDVAGTPFGIQRSETYAVTFK